MKRQTDSLTKTAYTKGQIKGSREPRTRKKGQHAIKRKHNDTSRIFTETGTLFNHQVCHVIFRLV